jgi:hypothetical protein
MNRSTEIRKSGMLPRCGTPVIPALGSLSRRIVNSRPAWATYRDPVSEQNKRKVPLCTFCIPCLFCLPGTKRKPLCVNGGEDASI